MNSDEYLLSSSAQQELQDYAEKVGRHADQGVSPFASRRATIPFPVVFRTKSDAVVTAYIVETGQRIIGGYDQLKRWFTGEGLYVHFDRYEVNLDGSRGKYIYPVSYPGRIPENNFVSCRQGEKDTRVNKILVNSNYRSGNHQIEVVMTAFYTLKSIADTLTFAFDRIKRVSPTGDEVLLFCDESGDGEVGQLASMTIGLWPAPLLKF